MTNITSTDSVRVSVCVCHYSELRLPKATQQTLHKWKLRVHTSTPRTMQRYSAYNYNHVNFARWRDFQWNSHTLVCGEFVKKKRKKKALLGGHNKARRTVNTSKFLWLNISVCLPKVPHNIIIDNPRSILSLKRNWLVWWRYPQMKQSEELIFLVVMLKENGKQTKTKQNKTKNKMMFLSFCDIIICLEFNLDVFSDKPE